MMDEKIKMQKGFIQTPLLVIILVSLIVILGIGAGIVLYKQGKLFSFPEEFKSEPGQVSESVEEIVTSRPSESSNEETQKRITELEQKIKELEEKQQTPSQSPSSPTIPKQETELEEMTAKEILENNEKNVLSVWCLGYDIYGKAISEYKGSAILISKEKDYYLAITSAHLVPVESNYDCTIFHTLSSNPLKISSYSGAFIIFPSFGFTNEVSQWTDIVFLKINRQKLNETNIDTLAEYSNYFEPPSLCSIATKGELLGSEVVGEKMVVLGYPTIGGGIFLSITEGIITSFEGASYNNLFNKYFITSAKIEQGNSGGGAFLLKNGCLVGMPAFAKIGQIESFGRLINLPWFFNNYFSKILPNYPYK